MDLSNRVRSIETRADLAEFVRALLGDLQRKPETWENQTLDRYLEAMAAWIESSGEVREEWDSPSWRYIGELLIAAKIYE